MFWPGTTLDNLLLLPEGRGWEGRRREEARERRHKQEKARMESKEAASGVKRPVVEQRGQEQEEERAEEGETGEKREEGSADGARERREQGSTGGCLWETAKTPDGFCDR